MAVVVLILDRHAAAVKDQLGNTGVVSPADLHHLLVRQTVCKRQNAADRRAVTDNGDAFSVVLRRNAR